jgi:hypothetical protein
VSRRDPTALEVKDYLRANGTEHDGRWTIGGVAYFEPAALKISEACLRLGLPLSAVMSTDLVLTLARRINALERSVDACMNDRAAPGEQSEVTA